MRELKIIRQNSTFEETVHDSGLPKLVRIVIKNSPFLVVVGASDSSEKIDFNDYFIECTLTYDDGVNKRVDFVKSKPIDYKTSIHSNGARLHIEVKIKVLSSQHEDMNFKVLVQATRRPTQRSVITSGLSSVTTGDPTLPNSGTLPNVASMEVLTTYTSAIKVISKPDQIRKKRGTQLTELSSESSFFTSSVVSESSSLNSLSSPPNAPPPGTSSGSAASQTVSGKSSSKGSNERASSQSPPLKQQKLETKAGSKRNDASQGQMLSFNTFNLSNYKDLNFPQISLPAQKVKSEQKAGMQKTESPNSNSISQLQELLDSYKTCSYKIEKKSPQSQHDTPQQQQQQQFQSQQSMQRQSTAAAATTTVSQPLQELLPPPPPPPPPPPSSQFQPPPPLPPQQQPQPVQEPSQSQFSQRTLKEVFAEALMRIEGYQQMGLESLRGLHDYIVKRTGLNYLWGDSFYSSDSAQQPQVPPPLPPQQMASFSSSSASSLSSSSSSSPSTMLPMNQPFQQQQQQQQQQQGIGGDDYSHSLNFGVVMVNVLDTYGRMPLPERASRIHRLMQIATPSQRAHISEIIDMFLSEGLERNLGHDTRYPSVFGPDQMPAQAIQPQQVQQPQEFSMQQQQQQQQPLSQQQQLQEQQQGIGFDGDSGFNPFFF